jgi:biofilm regulator BssS
VGKERYEHRDAHRPTHIAKEGSADMTENETQEINEDFGVLLGWIGNPAGQNIMLKMQSSRDKPRSDDEVTEFKYFLSKQQALQLGNFLYRMSGETAPTRKKPPLLERIMSR